MELLVLEELKVEFLALKGVRVELLVLNGVRVELLLVLEELWVELLVLEGVRVELLVLGVRVELIILEGVRVELGWLSNLKEGNHKTFFMIESRAVIYDRNVHRPNRYLATRRKEIIGSVIVAR